MIEQVLEDFKKQNKELSDVIDKLPEEQKAFFKNLLSNINKAVANKDANALMSENKKLQEFIHNGNSNIPN